MTRWPTYTVRELRESGCLLVEDGNHGEDRPRPQEFGSGETAFIRAADMEAGRVRFGDASRINAVAVARIRKGIGHGGDILFSHKGTVGKLARVPADAPPFVCSPQTTFWRVLDDRRLDREFLYAFMQSRTFRDQWASRKGETDMADYVSLTAQRDFLVSVPPIDEQRTIGQVLCALDEKIELNREMNRTLETTAQGIFKSWFVNIEQGSVADDWRMGVVADLARYVNGRNFTKGASGTGRMVIRIAELKSGPGKSTVYSDVEAPSENTARPDDLLFAWSGSLDVYRWHREEALINQHIFKVICDRYPKWFVYFHLREAMPVFQSIAADKATTMGHIKRGHLKEVEVMLPPGRVLSRVSERVEPLYDLIHENEVQSRTLAELRDLVLPGLLSGEVRIHQAEKAVEQVL